MKKTPAAAKKPAPKKRVGKAPRPPSAEHLAEELQHAVEAGEALAAELAQCKRELAHETAHGLARFHLIESVLAQRDVWQKMFHTQSLEHSNAQEMLTNNLADAGRVIAGLVTALNRARKKLGEEPLVFDKEYEGETVKKRFDEVVAELLAEAPVPIDALAERTRIDGEYAAARTALALPP